MNGLHPLMSQPFPHRSGTTPPTRQWILSCLEGDSALLRTFGNHSRTYYIGNQQDALLVDRVHLCCADGESLSLHFHHPVATTHLTNIDPNIMAVHASVLGRLMARCSEQRLGTGSEAELRRTSYESIACELSRRRVDSRQLIAAAEEIALAASPEIAADAHAAVTANTNKDNPVQSTNPTTSHTRSNSSLESLSDPNNIVDEIAEDLLQALDIVQNLHLNMRDLADEMQHLADVYGGRHTVATARRHGIQTFQDGAEVFAQGVQDLEVASKRARKAFEEGMRLYRESRED